MRVYFEFIGGCYDGLFVDGDEADSYFAVSHRGTVGHRFWTQSEYAAERLEAGKLRGETFHPHEYEVVEHIVEANEILIRAKFVGIGDHSVASIGA